MMMMEEQLVVLCDSSQEKYERLLEAHEKLQKLNQCLEDKLLKLAEDREREKGGLCGQIQQLTQRLVDARFNIHQLEDENERYRNDINVVVQLLQCKPSNFISAKIDTLPEDMQRKVQGLRNGTNRKEKKIIKVQVPSLPTPTDIMYAVDKSDKDNNNGGKGKLRKEPEKDMVSAAIMAKILEERESERLDNRKTLCRCASRIEIPRKSTEAQTMPSCTISYSDLCSDDPCPSPEPSVVAVPATTVSVPLNRKNPYAVSLHTSLLCSTPPGRGPKPPTTSTTRQSIQTDLDDICLVDYKPSLPSDLRTDFGGPPSSHNPYNTISTSTTTNFGTSVVTSTHPVSHHHPQHHHHHPLTSITSLPGYGSSRSSSSGCSSFPMADTTSTGSRESSVLPGSHHSHHHQSSSSNNSSLISSPTSSTTSNHHLLPQRQEQPSSNPPVDHPESSAAPVSPDPVVLSSFIKTTSIGICDGTTTTTDMTARFPTSVNGSSNGPNGTRRQAGHCIRVIDEETINNNTNRAASPPGGIYWKTTVLVPPPRNYNAAAASPPPSREESLLVDLASPKSTAGPPAHRRLHQPPNHLDLLGPSTAPTATSSGSPSETLTGGTASLGPTNGLANPLCNFHGNGNVPSAPTTTTATTNNGQYLLYQTSQPPHQYYRAQKRAFWTRSSSTTSTETEI